MDLSLGTIPQPARKARSETDPAGVRRRVLPDDKLIFVAVPKRPGAYRVSCHRGHGTFCLLLAAIYRKPVLKAAGGGWFLSY